MKESEPIIKIPEKIEGTWQYKFGPDNSYEIVADIQQSLDLAKKEEAGVKLHEMVRKILVNLVRNYNITHAVDLLDDLIQQTSVLTLDLLSKNKLREPKALPGLIAVIGDRVIKRWFRTEKKVKNISSMTSGAEVSFLARQKNKDRENDQREIFARAMELIDPRDREILERFYLEEQEPEQIMAEMGIDEKQFSNFKNRAIGKLEMITKALLDPKNIEGKSPIRKRTLKKN